MADIAASVLARLKNKAMETGRSNQLCLQLFCQEEFLRRLQRSRFVDNLILKGGLFVYTLTDFDSRVTVDVDFLLQAIPNTPEKLWPILQEIVSMDTGNDYIAFDITRIEPISVAKKYSGIGATIIARIKNTRTTFSIDFGIGDVIVPAQEKRMIPTQLEGFEPPVVSTYSVETTIAEKLDAILSLMEFSSRMKDYYDILYLLRKYDFEGEILKAAFSQTFANRGRDYGMVQFESLIALRLDAAMQRKWDAFLRKIKTSEDDFSNTLSSLDVFLRPVIAAMESGADFDQVWSCSNGCWQSAL